MRSFLVKIMIRPQIEKLKKILLPYFPDSPRLKKHWWHKLIKDKPHKLDLILTGHHGKKSLFRLADLVTEMIPIKHPFEKGFLAKTGVDY